MYSSSLHAENGVVMRELSIWAETGGFECCNNSDFFVQMTAVLCTDWLLRHCLLYLHIRMSRSLACWAKIFLGERNSDLYAVVIRLIVWREIELNDVVPESNWNELALEDDPWSCFSHFICPIHDLVYFGFITVASGSLLIFLFSSYSLGAIW